MYTTHNNPTLPNPKRRYRIENVVLKFTKTGIFRLGLYLRVEGWPSIVLCYLVYDDKNNNQFFIERFFNSLGLEYQEAPYIDLNSLINLTGTAIFHFIPAWGMKKYNHYLAVKKFLTPHKPKILIKKRGETYEYTDRRNGTNGNLYR